MQVIGKRTLRAGKRGYGKNPKNGQNTPQNGIFLGAKWVKKFQIFGPKKLLQNFLQKFCRSFVAKSSAELFAELFATKTSAELFAELFAEVLFCRTFAQN